MRCQVPRPPRRDPTRSAGRIQRTRNQFREPSGTTGTGPIRFERLSDFLERTRNLPPVDWLIDGIVPDSGRLFVVAAPNAGKTWLALTIAKSAAAKGFKVYAILEEGQPKPTGKRFESLAFPPDSLSKSATAADFA